MALSTDNEDLTVGLTASDLKVKLYGGSEVTLQKLTAEPIDGVKPNSVLCCGQIMQHAWLVSLGQKIQ